MRRLVKLLLVLGMLIMSTVLPASALGWTHFHGERTTWGTQPVRYCLEDGFYLRAERRETAFTAIERWNDVGWTNSALTLQAVHPNAAWPNDCQIHYYVVDFSARGWSSIPATTELQYHSIFKNATRANVYINSDRNSEFHWWVAPQLNDNGNSCIVGGIITSTRCDKDLDFLTVVMHETGHAVGLGHNTTKSEWYCDNDGNPGYRNNFPADACTNDFYSVDVMYYYAGDGYRRDVEQDSTNGIEYLY